jgi:hypothetical protein
VFVVDAELEFGFSDLSPEGGSLDANAVALVDKIRQLRVWLNGYDLSSDVEKERCDIADVRSYVED